MEVIHKQSAATPEETHLYFRFVYKGEPIGKPRMTQQDKWLDPPRPEVARWRVFRDEFFWTAWGQGFRRDMIITEIHIQAFLPFPPGWKLLKKKAMAGQPHQQTPDQDNILKAICDALQTRDERIWKSSFEKRWDDGQGARLEVRLFASILSNADDPGAIQLG